MNPETIQQTFARAVQHHQGGRLAEAEQLYGEVLTAQPEHVDAMHLLGVVAHRLGKHAQAVELIQKALELRPAFPEAYNNLGNALKGGGKMEEAVAAYRRAIDLMGDYAEAFGNLGNVLREMGQHDEATAAIRRAIEIRPNLPGIYSNLGIALRDGGQIEEAIVAYRQSIALNPDLPEAHSNLGIALGQNGQLDEAIAEFRTAVRLGPSLAQVHVNLGNALTDKGMLDEAVVEFQKAIGLDPKLAEAHCNLAVALKELGRLDEAFDCCFRALAIDRNYGDADANLASIAKERGQIDEAIRALAMRPDTSRAHSNFLFTLHYHPEYNAKALLSQHKIWAAKFAEPLAKEIRPLSNDRTADRRLRVGYVSADFRNHVVGRHLLPLFANLDRAEVEIFCYSDVRNPDGMTGRLREHVNQWRLAAGLSDGQLAEAIRADRIDILIDLSLHAGGTRLLAFACKPAAVQATWLGYCSTTGMSAMDYRISDPYFDPPEDELPYVEKTIRLPRTYWCYQSGGDTPDVASLPARREGRITFGCLNNFAKVSESAIGLWARVMGNVPDSRLLIQCAAGSTSERVKSRFEALGVSADRVQIVSRVPWDQYIRVYNDIDIALDPFPFGGGITTCDALWMGAAVVTLSGRTAVGRGGRSILSNVSLPELIAFKPEQYAKIATDLAHDLPRLAGLRAGMRARMLASPLMDAPGFARDMEGVYRQMWRQWCSAPSGDIPTVSR